MNRTQLINHLCHRINAKNYLEIGINDGINFNNIECTNKIGVDPNINCKHATHIMTSDEFFRTNNTKFDIIFIDGLHHSDQVLRDINNALNFLKPNGYIVCHDMNPHLEIIQRVPQETGEWTGDCWKAWVKLRSSNSSIRMYVVDTDWGCGVIQKGNQQLIYLNEELTWDSLCKNRIYWLNLISVEIFLRESL